MAGYRSVFRPDLFSGQTILITGGGTGIGRFLGVEQVSNGAASISKWHKRIV